MRKDFSASSSVCGTEPEDSVITPGGTVLALAMIDCPIKVNVQIRPKSPDNIQLIEAVAGVLIFRILRTLSEKEQMLLMSNIHFCV